MAYTKEDMRARFAELREERDAIHAANADLQAEYDAAMTEINEKLAALKPTQARLVEAKKPLVAIDEELAMLSRALNGKTGVVE